MIVMYKFTPGQLKDLLKEEVTPELIEDLKFRCAGLDGTALISDVINAGYDGRPQASPSMWLTIAGSAHSNWLRNPHIVYHKKDSSQSLFSPVRPIDIINILDHAANFREGGAPVSIILLGEFF